MDEYFYLCTSFVLSSDFVQSTLLKSIIIWQNIFSHLLQCLFRLLAIISRLMHHVRPVRNQHPLEILEHLKTGTKYLIQVFICSEDRLLYSVLSFQYLLFRLPSIIIFYKSSPLSVGCFLEYFTDIITDTI